MKWVTEDGKTLILKEMDSNHIKNCINFLKKKIRKGTYLIGGGWDADDIWCDEVDYEPEQIQQMKIQIKTFQKELQKRGL